MPGEKRHGSEFKRSALDGSEEQKDTSRDHLDDSDSHSDINRDGRWGKGVREKIKNKRKKTEKRENIKSEKQLRVLRRAVIRLKKALNDWRPFPMMPCFSVPLFLCLFYNDAIMCKVQHRGGISAAASTLRQRVIKSAF